MIDSIQIDHAKGTNHLRFATLMPGRYEIQAGMDSHSYASSSYPNDLTISIYAADRIQIYDEFGKTAEDRSVKFFDSQRIEIVSPQPQPQPQPQP